MEGHLGMGKETLRKLNIELNKYKVDKMKESVWEEE